MNSLREEIEKLCKEAGANKCIECGKCTASCIMGQIYTNFEEALSPRYIVRNIKNIRENSGILLNLSIWECLECEECTKACVSGVDYKRMMNGIKNLALKYGVIPEGIRCRRCAKLFIPDYAMNFILQKISVEDKQKGIEISKLLNLCNSCRRRFYGKLLKNAMRNH